MVSTSKLASRSPGSNRESDAYSSSLVLHSLSILGTALTSGVYPGRIDRILKSQCAVQSGATPAPLPQGEVQQLLQPQRVATVEVRL